VQTSRSGPEDVRQVGRNRAWAVTAGLAMAGGVGSLVVAAGIAAGHRAAAADSVAPGNPAPRSTIGPAVPSASSVPPVRDVPADPSAGVPDYQPPDPGLAPGDGQPQVQSSGS
jgi:hypothetical protein